MELTTTTYLGPARVISVAGTRMRIAIDDREVDATLALAYPYRPAAGDMVLVAGDERFWVIGVIQGSGPCVFTAPGSIEFRAPKGRIDFVAKDGVGIRTSRLELLAKSALQWIQDKFELRAGRVRQQVDGKYGLQARRIVERAAEDVKIDGRKINLG